MPGDRDNAEAEEECGDLPAARPISDFAKLEADGEAEFEDAGLFRGNTRDVTETAIGDRCDGCRAVFRGAVGGVGGTGDDEEEGDAGDLTAADDDERFWMGVDGGFETEGDFNALGR